MVQYTGPLLVALSRCCPRKCIVPKLLADSPFYPLSPHLACITPCKHYLNFHYVFSADSALLSRFP